MYRRHLKQTRRKFLSASKWRLRLVFWGSALIVGATAAVFAISSGQADAAFHQLYQQSPWLAYALPPFGLAFIAYVTRRYFKGAEGSGIPQTVAALSSNNHRLRVQFLSLKVAVGKVILVCMGLFCGASIGRAGPMVHIGASIMYSMRRIAPFRGKDMTRGLILAGGAAGLSAAFNTPLAGILFAIEEMGRSFEQRNSGTLIISVVLAGITALVILGSYTYFGTTDATLPLSSAWLAVLLCGIIGGLMGGFFSTTLVYSTQRVAPLVRAYPVRVAFVCGLILTLIGMISGGQTFGTGYDEAKHLVTGGEATASFPFLKLLATVASYLSGIPAGIYVPSLSIGAGLGADIAWLLPADIPMAAIVMLGMVGYFTGVVQTPITTFVIVMEITNDSAMLLPLMATALIAKGVSTLVCPRPIYQSLANAYLTSKVPSDEKKS